MCDPSHGGMPPSPKPHHTGAHREVLNKKAINPRREASHRTAAHKAMMREGNEEPSEGGSAFTGT